MTADLLSGIVGVIFSLLLSYVPPFKGWWDKLSGDYKRVVTVVIAALASLVMYGMACLGWAEAVGLSVTCNQEGALGLISAFLLYLVSNQAAYALSPGKH